MMYGELRWEKVKWDREKEREMNEILLKIYTRENRSYSAFSKKTAKCRRNSCIYFVNEMRHRKGISETDIKRWMIHTVQAFSRKFNALIGSLTLAPKKISVEGNQNPLV